MIVMKELISIQNCYWNILLFLYGALLIPSIHKYLCNIIEYRSILSVSLCDILFKLFLEAPDDIACFHYNPTNPNIIAGGCMNGQVSQICNILLPIAMYTYYRLLFGTFQHMRNNLCPIKVHPLVTIGVLLLIW